MSYDNHVDYRNVYWMNGIILDIVMELLIENKKEEAYKIINHALIALNNDPLLENIFQVLNEQPKPKPLALSQWLIQKLTKFIHSITNYFSSKFNKINKTNKEIDEDIDLKNHEMKNQPCSTVVIFSKLPGLTLQG